MTCNFTMHTAHWAAIAHRIVHATAGATLIASGEPCALCYMAALYFNVGHIVYAADRRTAAQYGFDYAGSYAVFAKDPVKWPVKVTSLPVEGARTPFEEFLAAARRKT
ncbi:MAG: hypothetical protein ACRDP3_13430 [Streptomyces sp.]|uniref:hypothetical protein n=1 Tax=Streptomyces sp. TaxID=1931 RepID=UPI003D6BC421